MSRLDAEQLLADAAWLRRLARALAGGADGDDLAQEVWLAALRHPPDEGRPARPWLAAVLRNALRARARGDRRRLRREQVVVDDRVGPPTPAELLERAEAQRELADLLVGLDEPFRRTVLLRYQEGMSAAEIARADGIPEGTVRWRLKEGLDRLRAGMDERHGGQRRRWALAFGMKGAMMANQTRRVAMTALLLLGVGGGAVLWWTHGRDDGAGTAAAPPAAAGGVRLPQPHAGVPQTTPDGDPVPASRAAQVAADADATAGIIGGRVINWSTGEPVEAVEVVIAGDEGTHTLATDRQGQFRFIAPRPGAFHLAVLSKPGYLPYAPDFGDSPVQWIARPGTRVTGVIVYLSPAIDYHGKVLSAAGAPVPGAEIRLLDAPGSEQALEGLPDRFVADGKGEFLFHAPDFAVLEASARGHGAGRGVLDGPAQTSHQLTIRLTPAGTPAPGRLTIAGRVVDGDGRAVDGASVIAEPVGVGHGRGGVQQAGELTRVSAATTTDDAGRFLLRGVDPGQYRVRARHSGHGSASVEAEAGARDVRVELTAAGRVTGRVVDSSGAPVPAFSLIVRRGDLGVEAPLIAATSVVDASGRFTVDDLAPGGYRLMATALGRAPSPEVAVKVTSGQAAEAELRVPAGGVVHGTVVSRGSGKPLQYARVSVEGPTAWTASIAPPWASVVTDQAGHFELDGLAPGLRSVTVAAYGHNARILSGLEVVEGGRIGPLRVELQQTAPDERPTLEIVGIGTRLRAAGDALVIDEVIAGGGAAEAGLTAGDAIVAVDGAAVTALGFDDALQRIRGVEGTLVRLGIRRGDQTLEVTVVRRKITA